MFNLGKTMVKSAKAGKGGKSRQALVLPNDLSVIRVPSHEGTRIQSGTKA